MTRRRFWGIVLLLFATSLVVGVWLYLRGPMWVFMEGAELKETILMEYIEPLGAGPGYVPSEITGRMYTIPGDVHNVAGRAFAELVPKGWEYAPIPWRLHPLEPRFLERELPWLLSHYEFSPTDPRQRERYTIEIYEWQGKTHVDVGTPTSHLDRLAHFLGRR
jgi:hypothetical protein